MAIGGLVFWNTGTPSNVMTAMSDGGPLVENDAVPAGSENSEPSLPGNEASDATASSPTGQPEASNPSLDKTQTPDPQVAPDVETPSEENAKAAEVGTPKTEKPKTDSADAEKPTQDMAKAESSESKEKSSPRSKGLSSQFDSTELGSTAYESKSAEYEGKSDLDNMFDLTAALMDFYVATTKELRENQQRYNDYINSITELNTYLTETTAMVSNAQTAIASAQSLVGQIDFEIRSFGRAGRDQLIAKRQAAAAEIALLGAKLAEARTTFPLKQNELRQKQDGLQIVQKQLKQLTAREGEYVTRLVTDLDLYQDKPKAYHERLKLLTDRIIPASPDVLVAHLLSGCSALALQDTETAENAVKELRRQLELVPQIQKDLRKMQLIRYQTIADLIESMRCEQLEEKDGALKSLQLAKNRDAHFADVWVVHGIHASKKGRVHEARGHFDRAIRLNSSDNRIHRVALQSLLGQDQVPVPIIKALTEELEEKAGAADWRSWHTLGAAYLQLGEKSSALSALNRITENSLNQMEVDALRKKIESSGK